MSLLYVYSGATGAGTGADWANAYTTLAAAVTGGFAGDVIYIAHDHAETRSTSTTLTFDGTITDLTRYICVDRGGSVPPVSADLRTTATYELSGSATVTISGAGTYIYGLIFKTASNSNNSSFAIGGSTADQLHFEQCGFHLYTTSTAATFQFGPSTAQRTFIDINNCTFRWGATGQVSPMIRSPQVYIRNCHSFCQGSTFPTTLFNAGTSNPIGMVDMIGVDLSPLGSATLFGTTSLTSAFMVGCELGASAVISGVPTAAGSEKFSMYTDSGDTQYRTEKYTAAGTLTTETTVVRTGGATDGTTPIAWKVVTTSTADELYHFECPPITIWQEAVGNSKTVTVECIWGGGAVPTDKEIYMEVDYLGTSNSVLSTTTSTHPGPHPVSTATNLAAGGGTWGGSTTAFKLTTTITPQEKGPLTVRVFCSKASSTFYICPKISVT